MSIENALLPRVWELERSLGQAVRVNDSLRKTIECQSAQIDMMREAIEYLMTWQVKNVDKWENSAYDFADRVLSKITPDQALEQFAERVRNQCAEVCADAEPVFDGYGYQCAVAIRAIKELP